jgi:pimeloyl-ACP methyl ester carboxylesterase
MKKSARVCAIVIAVFVATSTMGAATDETPPRRLIYLHGRIVQVQQSARPQHPRFGYYELEKILAAFRERGFVVSGEIRPKSASVGDSADKLVAQVQRLLDSGVPGRNITVLGGSMGAGIALVASTRLQNADVRFALLGICLSQGVAQIQAAGGKAPSGHLLSIREASDESTANCSAWRSEPASPWPLVVREMVLDTGLSHGFLYRPLPEWVNPVVEWAKAH